MNAFTDIQNYRHETVGKFKNIATVINDMNEDYLEDIESMEMLLAIHESFIKMMNASKSLILSHPRNEVILHLKSPEKMSDFNRIQIDGIDLFCQIMKHRADYYLPFHNSELVARLQTLLPLTRIED